jgi:hypothetical protein
MTAPSSKNSVSAPVVRLAIAFVVSTNSLLCQIICRAISALFLRF